MKTKLTLAALTAVGLLIAVGAMAQPGPGGRGAQFFDRFDSDGDGRVTEAEFNQVRADTRSRFDANNDGALSVEEFENMITEEMVRQRARRQFERMDADSDGLVTQAEADAVAGRMFQRMDANDDGAVTRDEIGRRGGSGQGGAGRQG